MIHAIQWLPGIAWAARRVNLAAAARWWLVVAGTAAMALMLSYSLLQTLTGHARFDISWWW